MTFQFSGQSLKKLQGAKPELINLCLRALELSPIDFAIVQVLRTQEYQDELYSHGRTKPGKIVTWTRKSKHIGGFAIDFAAVKDGAISWDDTLYPPIVEAFRKASAETNTPIVCGIDWKTRDSGHIELADV